MIDVSSGAGQAQGKDFSPIPKGVIAMGKLQLKFDNFGNVIQKSKKPDSLSERISARVMLEDEQYNGRYIFHDFYIKDAKGNEAADSDFIKESVAQLAAILEHAKNAHNDEAQYKLNAYSELNGLPVVIKIGQRRNKQTGETHNTVDLFLSPNPVSVNHEEYQAYMNGDMTQGQSAEQHNGF